MNISVMNSKDNWNIFSKNRNAIYGVAIISIMIFHFFEDIANSNLSGGGLGFLGKLYNTFIGSVGVEFFVFLSGVGLYFSMSKDSNILHFFQKRIKRILPAYLMVAIPYWIVIDLIIMQKGVKMFAFDFGFVTFFTQGTRTFWYVLFIVFAYLIYPFVYKILHVKWSDWGQLLILLIIALVIQFLPRIVAPVLNLNIEILLGRFLVFFIGCWCGKKVYQNACINNIDKMGILFGVMIMLCGFLPVTKIVVSKLGFRILMCFWGIFLLYCIAVSMRKMPKRIVKILEQFGKMSYELYLTHVAIRALMNVIGIKTLYFQNYVFCILISLFLTYTIVKLQKKLI